MKKLIIFLFTINFLNVSAFETDQILAGNIKLKDASDVMNDYFIKYQKKAIDWANKNAISESECSKVAIKSMSLAVGTFTLSAASDYATQSPLIDRFPDDSVSKYEYIKMSFYQKAWLPLKIVPLARTINIMKRRFEQALKQNIVF